MNLYDLTADWESVYQMLDDPDIPEDAIMDSLEGIEMIMEDKADSIAKILKAMDGDIGATDAEIKRLQARNASRKNRAAWLKKSLEDMMRTTGKTKFKTALFSFGIQKNGGKLPVEFAPGCNVPAEWLKPGDPDTARIREHLEAGNSLDFATLGVRGESLRIR